jgi:hypothetical protein
MFKQVPGLLTRLSGSDSCDTTLTPEENANHGCVLEQGSKADKPHSPVARGIQQQRPKP